MRRKLVAGKANDTCLTGGSIGPSEAIAARAAQLLCRAGFDVQTQQTSMTRGRLKLLS